jgi:hypothetical protein
MKIFFILFLFLLNVVEASVNPGITFLNVAALNEAVTRGEGDERNPFVKSVGCLSYCPSNDPAFTTITAVAPDVYMANKSFLHNLFQEFEKNKAGCLASIQFGGHVLTELSEMNIVEHEQYDLALVRLIFFKNSMPQIDFLRVHPPLQITPTPLSFGVSYGMASHLEEDFRGGEVKRCISIHSLLNFENSPAEFYSLFPCNQTDDYLEFEGRRNPAEAYHPLAVAFSTLGARGSVLVVESKGEFYLVGLFTTSQNALSLEHGGWVHMNNFINLTILHAWFEEAKVTLSAIDSGLRKKNSKL